jgi:PAS domain S-box-containing protein
MLEYNEAYQRFHQLLAGQITGDLETLAARQREQDQVLRMQARLQAERDRLYALFAQAPVAITILEGAQYVVRLANPSMLEIWARARQQVLDKPLFEAMPGIRQQGLEELLDGVRVSGKPHVSLQRPVELDRNGNRETLYFNFVYHPLRDDKGSITSIAVVAADVSEQVHSRQKLEESTRQLQALNGELSAANEEIKAGNEQLHASNEELQAANEELLLAREAQARLNSQLEARVEQRTAQLQQARAEVQGQRDRLERFFGQVPAAICVLDGPGLVFELVNPAFQQLYPGRELSGKTVREALPEISKGPFYAILEQVYQTGETYKGTEVPFPLARREGGPQEEVYFDFIYQARLDAHGRVDGILAFGYEVTAQVQARRQVAQAASELSLIMANAPVFLFRTDSAGNLHYVNQTLFEWSGLVLPPGAPLDEVWNLIHPEDLPFVQESFARSVQNQQAWESPLYRIRRRDGAYRWSITRTQPYLGEDGKLAGFSGVNVEIHQQVELQRQLETINRDLDNFVYTASHDLKAPILNIEGLLKALERQIGPEALQKDTVEKTCHLLDKQVNRFKATIADLTEVARISKESSEDATSINLTDVLEEVLGDLEPQRQEAGAQLTISLDCPAVFFSKKNLKSVLYNLLSNAIKYRSLDRKLLVRIGCQTQADYHVLSVEDNGLGMDMRQEEKIFALFKRLHAHVEGTGIGLYIVRKMVENAGGRIEVESKVGAGSTFRVYFPSAGG